MGITRISLKSPTVIKVNSRIGKQVSKVAGRKAAGVLARKLSRTSGVHYHNTVEQVGRTLFNPKFGSPAVAGSKTVNVRTPAGTVKRVTTPFWRALSAYYASRKPRNRTFWRKRGVLAQTYAQHLPTGGYGGATVRTVSVKTGQKGLATVAQELTFDRLPSPMDGFIREAFMSGIRNIKFDSSLHLISNPKRDSLETYSYTEGRRPLISQIASTLGRNLRKILQSIT